MGYYTDYAVTVENLRNEDEWFLFQHEFRERSGYGPAVEASEPYKMSDGTWSADLSLNNAKFYEYKEVLLSLSKKYPHLIIDVGGEGEESGDIWRHRFFNGKDEMVEAQLVFRDFTLGVDKQTE